MRFSLTADECCDDMADAIEEVELRDHDCFDHHHNACADDDKEGDDVQGSDGVEDDVAWASQ